MSTCSVNHCQSVVHAKGFCKPHYKCFARIGKPVADRQTIHGSIQKKFAMKSTGRNENGCWIWSGGKDKDGYGSLRDGLKMKRAHRVSWEIHHGEIPDGACVLHECNNPSCVNPSHLKLGDQVENMADRKRNGNPWHSESHKRQMSIKMAGRKITWKAAIAEKNRKLTTQQAEQVSARLKNGERVCDLAAELGIHRTTVSKLKKGTYFVH